MNATFFDRCGRDARCRVAWLCASAFVAAIGGTASAQVVSGPSPAETGNPPRDTATPAPPADAPSATTTPVPPDTPPSTPTPADPPWTFRVGEALFHPQLQVRLRGEERVHPYSSPPAPSDEAHFVTARFRIGLSLEWRAVRMLVQAQEARNFGTAPPGTDGAGAFGVHQAYGELRRGNSFVRVGRQEVAYGDERLIGPLDWTSGARSFDAVRAHLAHGILGLDAMAAILAPELAVGVGTPTPVVTNGDYLTAGQLALSPLDAFHVEVLHLYRRDRATAVDPMRDRRISALSTRVFGSPISSFRYSAEGVVEWGEVSNARFLAYAAAADAYYTTSAPSVSVVSAGGAIGSGERSGKFGEFENFFPTNHKFYGFADLFGWRNMIEGHATLNQRFATTRVTLFASGHTFFLERADARWTNAVGGLVAPATPGTSRYLGSELDVGGGYRWNELVGLNGGYSLFLPGSASERLGHSDATHWLWLMIDFRSP